MTIQDLSAKKICLNDSVITQNSYSYFCNSVVKNDSILSSISIHFGGVANLQHSDIFHIADCLGVISLIKNNIPNEKKLIKIEKEQKRHKQNTIELQVDTSIFSIKKDIESYELFICSPVFYEGYIYQEYKLVNSYFNEIKRIIIKIEIESLKSIEYCSKSLIYD